MTKTASASPVRKGGEDVKEEVASTPPSVSAGELGLLPRPVVADVIPITGRPALNIADTFCLPLDIATLAIGLVAQRGAGKSNAAAVLFEEMYDNAVPCVLIDPKGDSYGLRSSATGDGPGLNVPILGGLHGDVPLSPDQGVATAILVFNNSLTCVLDISEFNEEDRVEFLTDFGRSLFSLHKRTPQPRHLIIEEADLVIPQRVSAPLVPMFKAFDEIVRRGRSWGLGVSIVTQRPAVVNKNPFSQLDILVVLRTSGTHDRKAVKEWLQSQGDATEVMESVRDLRDGEAWVCGHAVGGHNRVQFRRRRTFDSGVTPRLGEALAAITSQAEVDSGALQAMIEGALGAAQSFEESEEATEPDGSEEPWEEGALEEVEDRRPDDRKSTNDAPPPSPVAVSAGPLSLRDATAERREAILAVLGEAGPEGLRRRELVEALTARGLPVGNTAMDLLTLRQEGAVTVAPVDGRSYSYRLASRDVVSTPTREGARAESPAENRQSGALPGSPTELPATSGAQPAREIPEQQDSALEFFRGAYTDLLELVRDQAAELKELYTSQLRAIRADNDRLLEIIRFQGAQFEALCAGELAAACSESHKALEDTRRQRDFLRSDLRAAQQRESRVAALANEAAALRSELERYRRAEEAEQATRRARLVRVRTDIEQARAHQREHLSSQ